MEQTNLFNGLFGKVASGLCRLSMNGDVAVKTTTGYKSYNVKCSTLTNCDNFILDIGDDFFFVIPTKHVEPGDIILVGGKPKCVLKKENDIITAINYEDSTVENIIPERHIFMGNTYFFGKIVSIFGKRKASGKGAMRKMMKYMMLASLLKNNNMKQSIDPMILMIMAGGGMNDLFDGLFDSDDDDMEEGDE